MSLSSLIYIGLLAVAWLFIKLAPRLFVRGVARVAAKKIGESALAKVPDQIQLSRVNAPQWKDAAAVQQQAAPLVRAGFSDLGTYSVDKMPGVLLRILFQPQTYVSAQICEHPKGAGWIEFATRYTDGSSDFLTTLPDQGIVPPPFVRTARAAKNTPADNLYQQHLRLRKSSGIKPVNQNEVAHEFEDAYMRYMIWKNNTGLSRKKWPRRRSSGLRQSSRLLATRARFVGSPQRLSPDYSSDDLAGSSVPASRDILASAGYLSALRASP